MERIQRYDEWKTTPLEEPVCYCETCGCPLFDPLYTIGGAICDDCLVDEYAYKKRMRSRHYKNVMAYMNEMEERKNERIKV